MLGSRGIGLSGHKGVRTLEWDTWALNHWGVRIQGFITKAVTLNLSITLQGTIEEKIYQRQISKQSLSGAVVDAKGQGGSVKFSLEDLRVRKTAGFFKTFLYQISKLPLGLM